MNKDKIEKLASERNNPCVTISLNTHRTHPDCVKDGLVIKNLCKEATERLLAEFNKREIASLLAKLYAISDEIDIRHNLESLHIFLSNDTKEIIKTIWPTEEDKVHISNSFSVRNLIKAYNRNENYLILLLSQSGVHLFKAQNQIILEEVINEDFPFDENPHFHTNAVRLSDPKAIDNMIREFLNQVDKAIVNVYNQKHLKCVVVCTEDNYSHLMHVAERPDIYFGYSNINYNNIALHSLVAQAWPLVMEAQEKYRKNAILEIQEAVSGGKVITDLNEIYRAAKEGRAELLISHNDFRQAVKMNGDVSFELKENAKEMGVIDDITSDIAWEVLSKKGRVIFTEQDEIKTLGNIALKVRY